MNAAFRVTSLLLTLAFSACTTATYGDPFTADRRAPDEYMLRIYVGGLSGQATADESAQKEIDRFMLSHGYKSFRLLDRTHNWVPSYFEYRIQFLKDDSGSKRL